MGIRNSKALAVACGLAAGVFALVAANAVSQNQGGADGAGAPTAAQAQGAPPMQGGPGGGGFPGTAGGPGGAGGRGRGPNMTVNFDDHTGFTQIFDGSTLNGWDGAPEIWSVQDGAIVGQSTTAKPSGTTFLIYRGSEPADFDMKFEMKLEGDSGNSGIQYRSRNALPSANFNPGGGRGPGGAGGPGGTPGGGQGGPNAQAGPGGGAQPGGGPGGNGGGAANAAGRGGQGGPGGPGGPGGAGRGRGMGVQPYQKWNMQGYQDDQNTNGSGSGNLWEGGRFPGERGTVTNVGQIMELEDGTPNILIGTVAPSDEVHGWWKTGDWNQEEIVARGNVLTHLINGHIISETIDDNAAKRTLGSGLIGIQIESGGDYKVSVRNVWLKTIK